MIEMSSQELLVIQQRLKKTILEHQEIIQYSKHSNLNQELTKSLHELQGVIRKLSEEQKIAVEKYREQIGRKDKLSSISESKKEDKKLDNGNHTINNEINSNRDSNDNDADNNENNSENIKSENVKSEPMRSIAATPRPALIIPQLGTNAITKQNVPINAQTIKMPALAIKSITGQTHFLVPVATATKKQMFIVPKKNVYNYLKPIVKLPLSSSPTSSSTSSSSSSQSSVTTTPPTTAQQVHSTSLLLRTHNNTKSTTKVPVIKSLNTNRSALKLTDKQMKDHFMMALGLVTKEALTELQSRKCERKRRTTANPQFSNAALEAKRITKMEIAERKAKRRLLITSNGETGVTANNNVSLITNSDIPITNTNSNGVTGKSNCVSNGKSTKSIGIEPQEISPGVHIVSSIGNLPANCNVCDEQCECDIDSILFCKYCRILFHATCSSTKAEICKNAPIPCPKCEKLKKQTEETVAKKREEKEKLSSKKKELDEKISHLRLALSNLKESLKEKEMEKKNLIAAQDAVQQKVNKFIETLKLVEETSQWEDRFAAALAATDPKKREVVYAEEENANCLEEQAIESMDAETEKATAQLEQLVKAEAESHSLEMDADMSEIYQLQCHENAVEMYDIFVEDVQESVIVTDGSHHVGFFDTESQTHESQHIHSGSEFNSDDRHVVLY